jgi:chemotaxis protein methyltransferase CheR
MNWNLQPFKTLIKERCGLLCEGNCEEKLARALDERSATLAINPADYYTRLRGDHAEFQELVNLLTINETYFFREPEQINLLVERIAPRLLAARGGQAPLRILSAGCSSGEEPYSLVMALMEKYGDSVAQLFSFAGGDLDTEVLNKARTARYTDFSFRGVPEKIRSRYFERDPRGHALKSHIKNLVSFHELNLLADAFPSTLRDFDIIFFRNVSIYFDTPTRKIIQRNLASLLKNDGLLMIGTAETLANDLGVLPLVEEDGLFYFVKGNPPLAQTVSFNPPHSSGITTRAPLSKRWIEEDFSAPKMVKSPLPPHLKRGESSATVPDFSVPSAPAKPKPTLDTARQQILDKHYDEALPALKALLLDDPNNIEALLLKAHALINRKAFVAAEKMALRVLANNAWSIDALLLLGLAAKWQQHHAEAIRHFKHAAYSRHECWVAHYYLADLYRDSGENELACRAYRTVLQLLSGNEPDTGIKYVPFGLPTKEIQFLSEHQLTKLCAVKLQAGQR